MTQVERCLTKVRKEMVRPDLPEPVKVRLRNAERALICWQERPTVHAGEYLISCCDLAKRALQAYSTRTNLERVWKW